MESLEERFLNREHTVLVESGDDNSEVIRDILSGGVVKGDCYSGSCPSGYSFSLERVYDKFGN